MKKFTLLISFLTLVFQSALFECAVHAESPKNNVPLFKTIDVNQDKKISMNEFSTHFFKVSFVYLDKNGDGKIHKEEWLIVEIQAGAEKMFNQLDSNQDGFITIHEFSQPQAKREIVNNLFRTLDKNGDGVLEEEELRWK